MALHGGFKYRRLKVKLADEQFNSPGAIDMLLGADLFYELLLPNRRTRPGHPVLQEIVLGWIISGRTPVFNNHLTIVQQSFNNRVTIVQQSSNNCLKIDKNHLIIQQLINNLFTTVKQSSNNHSSIV